jgi:hypothetical protein
MGILEQLSHCGSLSTEMLAKPDQYATSLF